MKKVCILYYGWYKAPNGAATFVRTMLDNQKLFKNNGVDLHVFSLDTIMPKDFSDKVAINKRNSKKNIIMKYLKNNIILMLLYMWIIEERHHRRVVSEYLNHNFDDDVVHCQEPITAYYLLKRCKKKKFRLFISLHSNGEDYSMAFLSRPCLNSRLGRWYLNRIFKFALSHADQIGFVSKKSMETYQQNHPDFLKDKLFYVYNGIPDNGEYKDFNRNIENINLVCVGGLSGRKNQECLVDAMAELTEKERLPLRLTFVGDGLIRSHLEEKVKQYDLHNIKFVGTSDNVTHYLMNSDIFILVSKDEGLPIAIIEAMRAGLPIIGSRVAGIPEMIDEGESGFVIEPNVSEVVKVIRKVLLSKEELPEMGNKSREKYLSKFTLDSMIVSYASLYLQ